MIIELIILIFMSTSGTLSDHECGISSYTAVAQCVASGQAGSPWDESDYDVVRREIRATERVAQSGDKFVLEERNGLAEFNLSTTSDITSITPDESDDLKAWCRTGCDKLTFIAFDDNIAETTETYTISMSNGDTYYIELRDDDISWLYFYDRYTHTLSASSDQPYGIHVTMSRPSSQDVCVWATSKTDKHSLGYAMGQWGDHCISAGSDDGYINLPTRTAGISGQTETITIHSITDGNRDPLEADVRIDHDIGTFRIKWVD